MRPSWDPKRTHDPVAPRRNKEGDLYLPPAKRPEVWETGSGSGQHCKTPCARLRPHRTRVHAATFDALTGTPTGRAARATMMTGS
jgi:hypothetical protein